MRWVWKVSYRVRCVPVRTDVVDASRPAAWWNNHPERHVVSGETVEQLIATLHEITRLGREWDDEETGWVWVRQQLETLGAARLMQVDNGAFGADPQE